jgi:hypothetical protein
MRHDEILKWPGPTNRFFDIKPVSLRLLFQAGQLKGGERVEMDQEQASDQNR